jgi:hypothetical protein
MDTSLDNQTAEVTSPIDLNLLPDEDSRKFVLDLIQRHRYHTGLARDLNVRYKRWSPFFMIFIPVYSAILSYLTTGIVESRLFLSLLALLLTIATILNSTLKPDEKFVASANVLVQLKDWEADMALSLIELDSNDRKQLKDLLRRKSVQLSEIGSSMARTYLPQKNA